MTLIGEVLTYLWTGKAQFRIEQSAAESVAENAFQSTVRSSLRAAVRAKEVKTNAGFIREVLHGHASNQSRS